MRELYKAIQVTDSEGIETLVLVDKDNLIPRLKTVVKIINAQIEDLESEQTTAQGKCL